ncbi:MAG: hypothetical protein Q9207_007271, partial [Kuettlingeria erythrocarpa]
MHPSSSNSGTTTPFLLPPELWTLILSNCDLQAFSALRLTAHKFYSLSAHVPKSTVLLNTESDNSLARGGISSYPCYTCLRLLPSTRFRDDQVRGGSAHGGVSACNRFCLPCGLRHGIYIPRDSVVHQGQEQYVCDDCGGFCGILEREEDEEEEEEEEEKHRCPPMKVHLLLHENYTHADLEHARGYQAWARLRGRRRGWWPGDGLKPLPMLPPMPGWDALQQVHVSPPPRRRFPSPSKPTTEAASPAASPRGPSRKRKHDDDDDDESDQRCESKKIRFLVESSAGPVYQKRSTRRRIPRLHCTEQPLSSSRGDDSGGYSIDRTRPRGIE